MDISNSYLTKLCGMTWKIDITAAVTSNGILLLSDGNTSINIPVTTSMNTDILVAEQIATYINQGDLTGWSATHTASSPYLFLYTLSLPCKFHQPHIHDYLLYTIIELFHTPYSFD